MSRWTIPASWALSRAEAIWIARFDRLFHRHRTLVDPVLEGGTGAIGHGDEELPVLGLADVENRADVGVIEGGGGAGFARKALAQQRFVAPLLGQELERHIAVEPGVPGPVDEPHTAAAEPFDDLVMGNRSSDHESPFPGRQRPDREPPEVAVASCVSECRWIASATQAISIVRDALS